MSDKKISLTEAAQIARKQYFSSPAGEAFKELIARGPQPEGQPQQDVCVLCSGQGFQEMNGVRVPCSCAESQPQQDAPIPEDLKRTYEDCKQYSLSLGDFGETVDGMVVRLIERIGRAETALTQAREALWEIIRSRPYAEDDVEYICRAALAATQPKKEGQ